LKVNWASFRSQKSSY